MNVDELLDRARESLTASRVYSEPVERDGITVIPAASVMGGGGGGAGTDADGQNGEGGGIGLSAHPAGAFVIKDGKLRWHPAIDVNRMLLIAGGIAVTAILVEALASRRRSPS